MRSERQLIPVVDFCVVVILFIFFTFEFSSHDFGGISSQTLYVFS